MKMKGFIAIILVLTLSLIACENDSHQQLEAQKIAQKNEAVFKNISKMWQFQFPAARPDIQTTLSSWNAWRQFEIELLQTPKYSIAPIKQSDVLFTQAMVFTSDFEVNQNLQITGFQPDSLKLNVVLNVAKGDQFYVLELPLTVALSKGTKVAGFNILLPTTATTAPDDACGSAAVTTSNSSGWEVFLLGFLGGLIALITPCVFPMIPVTVSFFTKRSKTKKQGIVNGLLYGVSIFLVYVLASVPFHVVGNVQPEIFNSISTNPWLNIIFFIIFIVFSISFFGFFENS